MAATPLPVLTHQLCDGLLRVAREGHLSRLQVETAAYASQAIRLQRAFFLGDGTGVGKTRIAAATLVDLLVSNPQTRCLWVSCRSDLEQEALSAFRLLEAGTGAPPVLWRKFSEARARDGGVSFTTYGSLRHNWDQPESNLENAVAWLSETGPFSLIILDEAHKAKAPKTQTFLSICELQDRLPYCGVLYSTATAASAIGRIGYMKRLGLFGMTSRGDPFPSYNQCRNALRRGGLTALELVALHLKSRGLYVSRALAPTNGSIPLSVALSRQQIDLYDACCARWSDRLRHLHVVASDLAVPTEATEATEAKKILPILRQDFFLRLLTSFKAMAIVPEIKRAISEGWSVVVSFRHTGKGESNGLLDLAKHAGVLLEGLTIPNDALDILINKLHCAPGVGPVAEITGRKSRRNHPDGGIIRRTNKMVESEKEAFQRDDIHVALLSASGGTAISLHALPGHRRRLHLLLELPWSAEELEQQCGRTHRTNEASVPLYRMVTTAIPADKRVAQVVTRRMHHLGALSRGDHRHHQDHTNGTTLLTVTAMHRAALEIMMREGRDILQLHRSTIAHLLPDFEEPARRWARQVLGVGDGYHHDRLCQTACGHLSKCLIEVDIGLLLTQENVTEDNTGALGEFGPMLRQRLQRLRGACDAVDELLPSRHHTNISRSWSFRHHILFSKEARHIALAVVMCAKHSKLGCLPKELLEQIISLALDDGWVVPPLNVIASLRGAGIDRAMLCGDPDKFMPKLCGAPVKVQLTVWSAIERAVAAEGNGSGARRRNLSPGAIDLPHHCHPTGVPRGCQIVCSDFVASSHSVVTVTLDLVPLPDATREGEDAINIALISPDFIGTAVFGGGPRIYWSSGTYTLRVVIPKRHSRYDAGAWDIEVFSPGCVEPIARLTHEKWLDYFHEKLTILSGDLLEAGNVDSQRESIRRTWDHEARVRIERRAQRCRGRRHVVKIITAEAALHKWESSSQVLVKGEPPLTPVPIIGVVA